MQNIHSLMIWFAITLFHDMADCSAAIGKSMHASMYAVKSFGGIANTTSHFLK